MIRSRAFRRKRHLLSFSTSFFIHSCYSSLLCMMADAFMCEILITTTLWPASQRALLQDYFLTMSFAFDTLSPLSPLQLRLESLMPPLVLR